MAPVTSENRCSMDRVVWEYLKTCTLLYINYRRHCKVKLNVTTKNKKLSQDSGSGLSPLSKHKPRGIIEQTDGLRKLFPCISSVNEELALRALPPNAHGWFVVPRWETLAPTYSEAVNTVLSMILCSFNGRFHNHLADQLGPEFLHQNAKSCELFRTIGNQQRGHSVIIVAAQLGMQHRGRSVCEALRTMSSQEFGLGAFAVGAILLTHPEYLQHSTDLWIDCAGDEFYPIHTENVSSALVPCFRFHNNNVEFDADWFDGVDERYGSASGFLG